jgi:hypothetical protein
MYVLMKAMINKSNSSLFKQPSIKTFMWVWGVSFLCIYAYTPIFTISRSAPEISLLYLAFISFLLSIPVGLIITAVILFRRHRQKELYPKQNDDNDVILNVSIGINMFCFFVAASALHISIYTQLNIGKPLMYGSAICMGLTMIISVTILIVRKIIK